jgi:N-methylhydantoinase B
MPDGVYRAASFLDNDGIDLDKRIECPVTVRIEGERFIVDFSDISPQVRGPFNSGRDGGGISSARIAFKYLTTPNDPTNEGSFAADSPLFHLLTILPYPRSLPRPSRVLLPRLGCQEL